MTGRTPLPIPGPQYDGETDIFMDGTDQIIMGLAEATASEDTIPHQHQSALGLIGDCS